MSIHKLIKYNEGLIQGNTVGGKGGKYCTIEGLQHTRGLQVLFRELFNIGILVGGRGAH
jgi:hypothetical protein